MKKLSFLFAALVAGVFGLSAQAVEKELIPYSSAMTATASIEYSAARGVIKAINGAGLNADGQHTTTDSDSWMAKNSGFPSGGIWYRVDLGASYNLCSIKVWNYNYKAERGAKETDIYYSTAENPAGSTSPSSDWTFLRTVEIEKATGKADYTGMEPIDFNPVRARYVLFHIKSVWKDCGGLSEVQFFQTHLFGDCSLTKIADGEFKLVGSVKGVDATDVKLVFSTAGQKDVEIDLGPQTAGAVFERTVTVSDGLLTTCLYRAKLVSTSVAGVNEFEFSDSFFFGAMPKVFDFIKKIDFTLSAAAQAELGESVVADVPVAIRVSTDIQGFDYDDMNADGTDVIFGAVDGSEITRYPYEVEKWDPNGESVFWVKVPSLSAATTISMCYGNNVFVPDNTPTDVWSNYAVVFHGGTFAEATEKGVAGSAGSDKVTATEASGWLGGGFNKSTCNSIGLNFTNPINAGVLTSINQLTISGWYRPTKFKGESTTVNSGILAANRKGWSNDGNGFLWLAEAGTYLSFSVGSAHNGDKATGFSWAKDQWSHFASTYDNKTYANYCNATLLKSGTAGNVLDARTANSWTFGGYAMTAASDNFCGDMDELRVFNGAASANYLKAEYEAMLPGFLVADEAQLLDPEMPALKGVSLVRLESGEVKLSFTVKKVRSTVKAIFSAAAMSDIELDFGTLDADASFERTFAFGGDLPIGRTYTLKLVVTNAANEEKVLERVLDPIYYGGDATISDCAKYIAITIPEGFRGELVDFPLLVQVSEATISGFNYADFKQGGKDLFFVDEGGLLLPYECEVWDIEGVSRFWVRVSSAKAGAVIKMYYGTEAPMPEPESGVWGDYVGVWHLNEAEAGAVKIADSSECGSDGTGGAKSTVTDGVLGGARGIPLGQAYGAVTVPKSAALDGLVPEFTVSGWVRPYTIAQNWHFLLGRKSSGTYKSWGLQPRGSSGSLDKIGVYTDGTADNDNNRAVFTTTGKFTANEWTKYAVVYTETTAALYLDGIPVATNAVKPGAAVNGDLDFTIGGLTKSSDASMGADHDEVRLRKGSVSADWVANEYAIEKGTLVIDYGPVIDTDPTAPALEKPTLVRNGDGSFMFTTRLFGGEGTVYAQFFDGVNTVNQELTTADAAYPKMYSAVATGLTAGTTYTYAAYGVNEKGSTVKMSGGIFHNGTLSVVKTADANEKGLVPGVVVFARENPGLAFSVPYAVGGTAEAGLVYEPLPGSVTIPAGETSVEVLIKPLICPSVKEDTTVTLAIEPGLYGISETAGAAEVTVVNLPPEVGYNTWTALVDGKASTAGNWSEGRVPVEGDNILFDGRFTVTPCEWDKDAPHTVASWTQREDFTGTVTVDTTFDTYSANFTNLVVTGDVTINGGTISPMTHGTTTDTRYRLMMTVGGDFTIGAAGTVSVAGLGRFSNQTPWGGSAAHGGDNASGTTAQYNANDPAYGEILAPMAVAHGSQSGTDSNDKKSHGGGALYLVVAGDFTNGGVVTADGEAHYSACGAGGSIYIAAANIYGAGKYSSSVPAMGKTDGTGAVGSGGRIALVAKGVNEAADISCTGRYEGWGRRGAAGTVYLKGEAVNEIRVKNSEQQSWNMIQTTTPIPAEGDTMNWKTCAKSIDLVGDWCAHLRLTQPVVKMNSLSLLSEASNRKSGTTVYYRQSDLDLAGKILQVRSVIVDGVDLKLPVGDYTLADADTLGWTWLKDSSHKAAVEDNPDTLDVDETAAEVPGTGILRVVRGGMMLLVR